MRNRRALMAIAASIDPHESKRMRDDLAKSYRNIRSANPAMARLLYRRMKEATEKLAQQVFGCETAEH